METPADPCGRVDGWRGPAPAMERGETQATQATSDVNVAQRLQRPMLKQKNGADGLQQK